MKTPMEALGKYRKLYNTLELDCVACIREGRVPNKTIKSHNIQKKGALNFITRDEMVYVYTDTMTTNKKFSYSLTSKHINNVTIFKCLCLEHDTSLFSNIETEAFKCLDDQYGSLALKSLLFEYWKINVAVYAFMQSNSGDLFLLKRNELRYLENDLNMLFEIVEGKRNSELITYKIILPNVILFTASQSFGLVCDFFGLPLAQKKDDPPYVHFSAFTEKGKSYLVFSWLKKDDFYYKDLFTKVAVINTSLLLYNLNLMLWDIENIVISPYLYDALTDSKKDLFVDIN